MTAIKTPTARTQERTPERAPGRKHDRYAVEYEGERECLTCREPKHMTEFQVHKGQRGGRTFHCKECLNLYKRLRDMKREGAHRERNLILRELARLNPPHCEHCGKPVSYTKVLDNPQRCYEHEAAAGVGEIVGC